MYSKKPILCTTLAICALAAPVAMAGGGRGQHPAPHFSSVSASRPNFTRPQSQVTAPARTQPQSGLVASNARHPGGRVDHDWHHRHHHHHHHHGDAFFFGNFGYPFYGFGYGYPYAYRSGYPYYSYGYDPSDYSAPLDASLVVQVQRKLARAGYYRGAIDGVIGAGTRGAVRAYERSHRLPVDGVIDDDLLATMGLA